MRTSEALARVSWRYLLEQPIPRTTVTTPTGGVVVRCCRRCTDPLPAVGADVCATCRQVLQRERRKFEYRGKS